jgi:hypothetical protein
MEITFKGKLLSESLLDEYQTRWKIHRKRMKSVPVIFGIFSIALSCLLVFLYFLQMTSKKKKHLLTTGKSSAEKYAGVDEMTVDFGDDFIQLDKKLTVVKLSWTLFSQIFYIDQFIFIAFSIDPLDSICLDTNMISAAELDQIKTFLDQKIKSSQGL